MKIIIFAGGVGKRLWPLSRQNSPKQFQKLFGNETTLENSYNTIKEKFSIEDIYISTNEKFADHVYSVMPNLPKDNLILEPESRDTGAAVAFAMLKIKQQFPNEPVVIRWQNSLIKNSEMFVNSLDAAESVFQKKQADFLYIAVPAKYANTNVGHIHLGKKLKELKQDVHLYDFIEFTEKPESDLAIQFTESGNYVWNPGCYITTPNFMLEKLEEHRPEFFAHIKKMEESFGKENEKETIKNEFSNLEKLSIDYLLWEKLDSKGIKVVVADYDWHYVSTWADLKAALSKNPDENITKGKVLTEQVKDSLIYNYDDKKLVGVIGLEGVEVINTDDAVLVVKKEMAGKVKDLLGKIEDEGFGDWL